MPRIVRETVYGVPRYGPADRFLLSGAERLVPVRGGGDDVQRYRPAGVGLFARIERHTETVGLRQTDYWEVWTADGLRSRYGTVPPAEAVATSDAAAACGIRPASAIR